MWKNKHGRGAELTEELTTEKADRSKWFPVLLGTTIPRSTLTTGRLEVKRQSGFPSVSRLAL